MKRTILVLATLSLFAGTTFAAEPTAGKMSNLEAVIVNNDKLLQYDSYDMGIADGSLDVNFKAMIITDPEKGEVVVKGMKVTILGEKEATSTVYLDLEETQALAKSIGILKATSVKFAELKREPYTEITYSSKGGFKFGYLNKGAGAGMFSSSSVLFIKSPDLESEFKDDEKRFSQFQSIINNVLLKITK